MTLQSLIRRGVAALLTFGVTGYAALSAWLPGPPATTVAAAPIPLATAAAPLPGIVPAPAALIGTAPPPGPAMPLVRPTHHAPEPRPGHPSRSIASGIREHARPAHALRAAADLLN